MREMCEKEAVAISNLGMQVASALKARLADLRAAPVFTDFTALGLGNPRHTVEGQTECFAIEIADGYVLIVCANHPNGRYASDKSIDWCRVRRIKVVSLYKVDG